DSAVRVEHGFITGDGTRSTGPGRSGAVPFIEVKALGSIPCVTSNGVLNYRLKGNIKITQKGSSQGLFNTYFTVIRLPSGMDPDNWQSYELIVNRYLADGSYREEPRYFDIEGTAGITLNEGDKLWVAVSL